MSAVLHIAPVLFVLLAVWLGRYPGEGRLVRVLRAKRVRSPRRRTRVALREVRSLAVKGGALLAAGLQTSPTITS